MVTWRVKREISRHRTRRHALCTVDTMPGLCGNGDRKALTVMTSLFACLSFAFLCIAVATDYWLYAIELVTDSNLTTSFQYTHSGLWKQCVTTGKWLDDVFKLSTWSWMSQTYKFVIVIHGGLYSFLFQHFEDQANHTLIRMIIVLFVQ